MKKIGLLIFTFVICLLSIGGVDAATSFKCMYDNTHSGGNTEYWITYEKNGDMLLMTDCTKNGGTCNLTMDLVDWSSGGNGCPDAFNIYNNKIVLTSYKQAEYIHYYTWECEVTNNNAFLGLPDGGANLYPKAAKVIFRNNFPDSDDGFNVIYKEISSLTYNGELPDQFVGVVIFEIKKEHTKTYDEEGNVCPYFHIASEKYNKEEYRYTLTLESSSTYGDDYYLPTKQKFGWNKSAVDKTGPSQCYNYKNITSCKNSLSTGNVACVWVDKEDYNFLETGYCNVDNLLYVGCGGAQDIPTQVPALISLAVNLLKIATPIILIFISIITLLKAMSAGKEDEIKKATSSLVKKLIAAAMVFFVIAIVQFVIGKVAEDDEYQGFEECLNCFLNNNCKTSTYYKTVVSGEDHCTPLTTGKTDSCKNLFKDSE